MAGSGSHTRRRKGRVLPTLTAGLAGAAGIFLYGLFVGRQIESVPGIEAVARLWWFGLAPVVLAIVLVTVVTARRVIGSHIHRGEPPDELQRRREATLQRLSLLVGSVASENRTTHSESQGTGPATGSARE